jgi:hypothetical protein
MVDWVLVVEWDEVEVEWVLVVVVEWDEVEVEWVLVVKVVVYKNLIHANLNANHANHANLQTFLLY